MEKANGNCEVKETAVAQEVKNAKVLKHRKRWSEKTKKEKVITGLKVGGNVVLGVGALVGGPKLVKLIFKGGKAVEVAEQVVEAAEPVVEATATIA